MPKRRVEPFKIKQIDALCNRLEKIKGIVDIGSRDHSNPRLEHIIVERASDWFVRQTIQSIPPQSRNDIKTLRTLIKEKKVNGLLAAQRSQTPNLKKARQEIRENQIVIANPGKILELVQEMREKIAHAHNANRLREEYHKWLDINGSDTKRISIKVHIVDWALGLTLRELSLISLLLENYMHVKAKELMK